MNAFGYTKTPYDRDRLRNRAWKLSDAFVCVGTSTHESNPATSDLRGVSARGHL